MSPRLELFLFAILVLSAALTVLAPHTTRAQTPPSQPAEVDEGPWRLHGAIRAPDWLILHGVHRTRYAALNNQFRPGLDERDQALAFRTLFTLGFKYGPLRAVGELQDSRAYLTDDDSGASTIVVNALEPLQAYVGLVLEDAVHGGDVLDLRAGRQTMDVGGRRLIARNTYRNTIQNYNGVTARWRGSDGSELLAFGVLPVPIHPTNREREAVLDNEIEIDRESFDLTFWGLFYKRPLGRGVALEGYVYGLHERDGAAATRNRRLFTPGLRALRSASAGQWDLDLESVLQAGTRRATTDAADEDDHRVLAHFHHAAVGYTFRVPWSPRLSAELDYGSGDDPSTERYGRFDSLFGPRRADFGPTGIYGPLGRENIVSAGLRAGVEPHARVDAFLSWRANALADPSDTFARTGVVDPAGASGRFAGNQLEARARIWLVPGSIRWEIGGAAFFRGRFLRDAPNATGYGDPLFLYTDLDLFL